MAVRAVAFLWLRLGLAGRLALAGSTCGSNPDKVPGCEKRDLGSCGNACCVVEAKVSLTPEQTYESTKKALESLSSDGFAYITGGSPNPTDDLRAYNISSPENFKFILQGRHDAPKYFGANGDVLDFAIYTKGTGSVLRMFSLSRIHGALGDQGQNYKTLSFLAEKMVIKGGLEVLHGCGKVVARETGLLQRSLRASYPSSCGGGDSKDPECQQKDMGSCGNACCLVELNVAESPEQAYKTLKNGLETLTDDGFAYITGGSPNPTDDLRAYNISSPENFKFILQGRHDAPKYFGANGDVLDFAIYTKGTGSVLRMFSLSRIHGALGDQGQNYKSLSLLAKLFGATPRVKYGCGAIW